MYVSDGSDELSMRTTETYSHLHALLCDKLHTAHDVLLHLDELRQFLGKIGAKGATGVATKGMACVTCQPM